MDLNLYLALWVTDLIICSQLIYFLSFYSYYNKCYNTLCYSELLSALLRAVFHSTRCGLKSLFIINQRPHKIGPWMFIMVVSYIFINLPGIQNVFRFNYLVILKDNYFFTPRRRDVKINKLKKCLTLLGTNFVEIFDRVTSQPPLL